MLVSIYLILAFVFASAKAEETENCRPFGCPNLPLDVIYDSAAHEALSKLRKGASNDIELALQALKKAGDKTKTTLTLKGYKGGKPEDQINQDRAMIYSPFVISSSSSSSSSSSTDREEIKSQLVGVFDGHGYLGEKTAEYAVNQIPRLLSEKLAKLIDLNDETEVIQVLKTTFMQVDETDPTNGEGGCTASIILQLGERLYVANAGDSISFVSVIVKDSTYVVFQSREDVPDLPEERKRITEAGGYVDIPDDDEDDVPRAYSVASDGSLQTGLAMSRCLGDWENQGVIAVPLVNVLNVTEIYATAMKKQYEKCMEGIIEEDMGDEDKVELKECIDQIDSDAIKILAVSATDGVMDYFDSNDVAYSLATAFFLQDEYPHLAAERLILRSAQLWDIESNGSYRDDITIAASTVFVRPIVENTGTAVDKDTHDEL